MSRYSGLKDEHLLALGKVAVMGAQLERTVEMCLKVRLQLDEKQADKLIYKQNFAYKVELLTTLHPKDDDAEYQKELGQLTSKLGELMTKRHTVIHADWEYEFDKPAKTVQEVYDRFIGNAKFLELSASKKKHGKSNGLKVKASTMEKVADDLEAVTGALWDFGFKYWWTEKMHPFQ